MNPDQFRGAVKRGAGEALLGFGGEGGSLEKLTIVPDVPSSAQPVVALFNPDEISRSRSVRWSHQEDQKVGHRSWNHGMMRYIGRDDETLSVSLFFDTYEWPEAEGLGLKGSLTSGLTDAFLPAQDYGVSSGVDKLTKKVLELTEVAPGQHRPPVCKLRWGKWIVFEGVLTSVGQKFTMFLPSGTPVRATLDCTFTAYVSPGKAKKREVQSADIDKTRTVRRGDTLHSLAAEEYGDPALWRTIARANGIRDPLALRPGTVLILPRLAP